MQETKEAQPQLVRWGPSDDMPAGVWINSRDGQFTPWAELKIELESRLLNQLGLHVPLGSTLITKELLAGKIGLYAS
jgi:hypothetical protein